MVRTGDVITTPWARPGFTLDVAYPVRERFTSPEGMISEVVRFCGHDNFGQWVENAAGMRVGHDVYLVRDSMDTPAPWGEIGVPPLAVEFGESDQL